MKYQHAKYNHFDIDLTDLVRPGPHHWCACHTAVRFEAFRWFASTSERMRGSELSGVRELLSCARGTIGHCSIAPIRKDWDAWLAAALHGALLGGKNNGPALRWRQKYGIKVYTVKRLALPATAAMQGHGDWHMDSARCAHDVDVVFAEAAGARLRDQHNEYHPRAVWVHEARLVPCEDAWVLDVDYGYKDTSSSWLLTIAEQQPHEAFPQFIKRATQRLRAMCVRLTPQRKREQHGQQTKRRAER